VARRWKARGAAALALVFGGSLAAAPSFSGSLVSRGGWWCGSGDLDPRTQYVAGKVSGKVGDPDRPAAQYQAELRADYDPETEETEVSIRETWVKAILGPVDLSVGKQILSWGTADVFTPIDVVNPRDYSLPPASADEKLPLTMLRSVINGEGLVVDLVAVPFFAESKPPAGRWVGGLGLPAGVPTSGRKRDPAATIGNMEFGGRAQRSFDLAQGLDLACSAFYGRETLPTAEVSISRDAAGAPTAAIVEQSYRRLLLVGLDGAFALGNGVLLKAEGSYSTFDRTDFLAPRSGCASTEALGGWEYTVLGVKTIGEYDAQWTNDGGSGSWARTALIVLSGDVGSRTSYKLTAAWDLDGSGFLVPQATYTIADGLAVEGRAYAFWGLASTKYGEWKDDDVVEATVKYSF